MFFFVFFSRTDRFFNLSCHLFSYPLSLKQTSSFTKFIFLLDFLKKIKRGKKSFLLALSLCRSIKGSQLTPHVQVRLTCLPSKIHVFLFNQISCLQSVVCEYSIIFIYLHVSLCKSPCGDVFSGVFFTFQYIYIYSSSFVTSLHYYYFFCVRSSSFSPVGQTGFSIFHVISFLILSA